MPRMARVVAPQAPHHVTQRGNRRQQTFFSDDDYLHYLAIAAKHLTARGVEVWAYCLMPNHVHLIAVPRDLDSLRRGIGETHRRYSRAVNFREGWRGYLWQGRFVSCVMDEPHLLAAARYLETNPLRAGLVERPEDWPFSSARAHLAGEDDELVKVRPLLKRVPYSWAEFLALPVQREMAEAIRLHQRTGRPLGGRAFVKSLERKLHRPLLPQTPGRKPENGGEEHADK